MHAVGQVLAVLQFLHDLLVAHSKYSWEVRGLLMYMLTLFEEIVFSAKGYHVQYASVSRGLAEVRYMRWTNADMQSPQLLT